MRAENLEPLFMPGDTDAGLNFAQGTVYAFNPNTGENSISVNGTVLTNVPMLNTSEAITYKPGHVVCLLRWRSQWFVLGRLTVPGGGQFASASVAFASSYAQAQGFAGPGGFIADQQLAIPSWASQVIVIATGMLSMNNTSGALSNLSFRPVLRVNNDDSTQNIVARPNTAYIASPANYWAASSVAFSYAFDIDPTVNKSITTWVDVLTTWPAHADNSVSLTTQCIFRSSF